MIDERIVKLLACPESHQALRALSPAELLEINSRIAQRQLKNLLGTALTEPIQAGLIRQDGKMMYRFIGAIPVLLTEEGIPLA
jgi:uncharacterized protein YbaR (Trm112 family)